MAANVWDALQAAVGAGGALTTVILLVQTLRTRRTINDVHTEVRSPNGKPTAAMVEEIRLDVKVLSEWAKGHAGDPNAHKPSRPRPRPKARSR